MSESGGPIDLLVLGGGMAGLSAAALRGAHGASVVLVEKAPALGGSAAYAGFIHTPRPSTSCARSTPAATRSSRAGSSRASPSGLDWVRSLGVHVADPVPVLGYSRGCQTDMASYLLALRAARPRARRAARRTRPRSGCCSTTAPSPARSSRTAAGERTIHARSTLLATGGFGGDPELRAQHIHPLARDLPLRANVLQHRRRPAAGAAGRSRLRPARRRLLRPPDPVVACAVHEPVRVRRPDLLPRRARHHRQPRRAPLLRRDARRPPQRARGPRAARGARADDHRPARPRPVDADPVRRGRRADRPVQARLPARRPRARSPRTSTSSRRCPEEWGYPGATVRDTLAAFNAQCASGTPSPARALTPRRSSIRPTT